jgi:hypothetical protein
MFFWKKGKFVRYSKRVRQLLDKGNYDGAIARYNKFDGYYKLLSEEKKLEYKKEYESLLNQLLIYMKIRDLNVIIKGDDVHLIEDSLKYIEYLSGRVGKVSENYKKFVKAKYHGFHKEHDYKLALKDLNEVLEKVYKLRDEQNYDGALLLFPELMKKYRELEVYLPEKAKELLKELIDLREELKFELLEFRAYSNVAETNVKTLRKALKKKRVEEAKELHGKVFGQ